MDETDTEEENSQKCDERREQCVHMFATWETNAPREDH